MDTFAFNSEVLGAVAGALISLLLAYFPGLSAWFQNLPGDVKRLILLAALFLGAAGVAGLSCAGVLDTGIACTVQGAWVYAKIFIISVLANQGTYSLLPSNKK